MPHDNGFNSLDQSDIDLLAKEHGFRKRGARTWWRRTADFVQVINLQKSQWLKDISYLNFALWPLKLGEPPTLAESKFHLRMRAEAMRVRSLESFFEQAEKLTTVTELAAALDAKRISGLVSKELRPLLQ
jgi:hypothetical protein